MCGCTTRLTRYRPSKTERQLVFFFWRKKNQGTSRSSSPRPSTYRWTRQGHPIPRQPKVQPRNQQKTKNNRTFRHNNTKHTRPRQRTGRPPSPIRPRPAPIFIDHQPGWPLHQVADIQPAEWSKINQQIERNQLTNQSIDQSATQFITQRMF